MILTRLTLDIDVLVLFELPLSRSVFALVGLLILHFSVGNLSDFVARFSDFSDPFGDFKKKKKMRLAINLATFGKTLATFQMLPVLSCEHEILSYTSPCVCSDQ